MLPLPSVLGAMRRPVLLTWNTVNLFTMSSDRRERVSATVREHRIVWRPCHPARRVTSRGAPVETPGRELR